MLRYIITLLIVFTAFLLPTNTAKKPPHEASLRPKPIKQIKALSTAKLKKLVPLSLIAVKTPQKPSIAASGDWVARCKVWANQAGVPLDSFGLELIRRESTCNPNAVNPDSGACGIGQDIKGCSVGSDPVAQLKWMWDYVQGRYSTWQEAVAFHDGHNWY